MNRIAERVVPVMNEEELRSLLFSNYEQDAQTLTGDNEANLLKFKELMDTLTAAESERWEAIKYAYVESVRMGGVDASDSVGQVMRQLQAMRDGLESIRRVLQQGIAARGDSATQELIAEHLGRLGGVLAGNQAQLGDAVRDTAGQLRQLVEQSASDLTERRVLVQHKVPRVLLDVIRGQFHLIQEWLRPLAAEAQGQGREVERLRKAIEQVVVQYEKLKTDLEE